MRLHLIDRATGTTRIFATPATFYVIEPVNAYDTDGALSRSCLRVHDDGIFCAARMLPTSLSTSPRAYDYLNYFFSRHVLCW